MPVNAPKFAVVSGESESPGGIPAPGHAGRFGYTGQAWFGELGLYDYKARWYSPTLGRFMQADPIGYGDGMNMYDYAHSDPVNGSDPSGLADNEIVVVGHKKKSESIAPPINLLSLFTGYGSDSGGGSGSGGSGSAPGPQPPKPPKPGSEQPNCNTVLPNDQTVGQIVRNAVQNILADANASDLSPDATQFGAFFATVQGHGPIDFKNIMGPDPTGRLGAAGNFAYGAIASGIGYSQSFAEFGAGVYAAMKRKSNFNNPFGEDNSAAANLGNGYATDGCTK